jgi:hypothetical protein
MEAAQEFLPGLLKSYGELEKRQDLTEQLITERTGVVYGRLDALETGMTTKADKTELSAVVKELSDIKKLLIGLLLAIVTASIGFGFAALQIAGSHAG